jgi:hypothetical protein
MNRTNLENLRGEMKLLKFDDKLIGEMEQMLEKGLPAFELKAALPADRGQLDVTLHFKQSGQSEYYYLNRYDLALSRAKPLEGDLKYLVISPNEEGKNMVKKFDSPTEAISFFQGQQGKSELAIGKNSEKDLPFKDTVATMADGKVDYVKKEFQKIYYSPALTHTMYVEKGQGFNVLQAANMLQGRSAYRDGLVSRQGVEYKAWNQVQFDLPKDRYGNYQLKQYNENYGFDLKQVMADYKINLPGDTKQVEQLLADLKDGSRPVVSVADRDGKESKMMVEAVPRYGNLNFYEADSGKPVKREELLKEEKQEQAKTNVFDRKLEKMNGKEHGKVNGKASQEMSR